MNQRERLLTALSGRQPDAVPTWELAINQPVIRSILQEDARAIGDLNSYMVLTDKLDIEGLTAFEAMNYGKVSEDVIQDEWGIKFKVGDQGEKFPLDGPVKKEPDLHQLDPPDPKKSYRWNTLKMMKSFFDQQKALAVCVHDAFEYSWFLRGGMDKFFLDMYRNPGFIKSIIDIVVEYNVGLIEEAARLGADFVCSGDDYAYKAGPLISPEQFREFFLPGLKRIVEATHKHDLLFLKHSDGDVRPLLDQFIEAEVDALCPLEPMAGMEIGQVKREYGDQIALVGNIDCSELLVKGSKDEVRKSVRECISKASPGGGHVLSSSNTIHYDVDPDNYLTMLEALREFGTYPISTY